MSLLAAMGLQAGETSVQSLFQTVPAAQLSALGKLPSLRQSFGSAVALIGASVALSQKYPAAWSRGTRKSVLCQPQSGGYHCDWRYELNGTAHAGYVLIAATGDSYRLEKVVELPTAVPPVTTKAMSPLWY